VATRTYPPQQDSFSPTVTSDFASWIHRVCADNGAFVGRSLRYLGVPERDLPDACQEVFVVVARRRDAIASDEQLRPYLYGVAVNVARNARRTSRRRPEVAIDAVPAPILEAAQTTEPAQEQALVAQEERAQIQRWLDTLDDTQREVFVLHDVEERPMREITDTLGIPLQTGYSRLRLAREALARIARGASR